LTLGLPGLQFLDPAAKASSLPAGELVIPRSPDYAAPRAIQEETDTMAFYELRQYFVRPGKMNEWVKIMEEEIIPFQVSKGMVICGSFRGETDESCYIWIRRFDSEEERKALYKAVYETDHWKTKIDPRIPECLDREKMHIQRIVPTSRSTMQ
jgi:NIPSNAP